MSIPPEERDRAATALEQFCLQHSSAPGAADAPRYAYEFEANAALLLEQRPGFMNPDQWHSAPMAKFRYSQARNEWSLYWNDANDRWHRVPNVKPAKDIRVLLGVVVADPLGVFWS